MKDILTESILKHSFVYSFLQNIGSGIYFMTLFPPIALVLKLGSKEICSVPCFGDCSPGALQLMGHRWDQEKTD